MKKIIALLLAAIMCFGVLTACGKDETNTDSSGAPVIENTGKKINTDVSMASIGEESVKKEVTVPEGKAHVIGLTLKENTIAVVLGQTAKIEYTVKPESAHDGSAYYVSSNPEIAKVDKDGNVLGVACGSTTVDVITNDQGFKRTVKVIVYQNVGDEAKSKEMAEIINKARVANGQTELKADDVALNAAANQRALEEAIDMVNNGEDAMNDKRTGKETTVFADFDIWVRASASLYVWGDYSADTQKAYDALVANEGNATAIGAKGEATVNYDNLAVGYFVFNDVTYWCVVLASN